MGCGGGSGLPGPDDYQMSDYLEQQAGQASYEDLQEQCGGGSGGRGEWLGIPGSPLIQDLDPVDVDVDADLDPADLDTMAISPSGSCSSGCSRSPARSLG